MWLLTEENSDDEVEPLGVFDIPETAMNLTSEGYYAHDAYQGGYWELTPWGTWERRLNRYSRLLLRELPVNKING